MFDVITVQGVGERVGRVWHRWQYVPHGTRIRDDIGRPWLAQLDQHGQQTFTDGTHIVHPSDIEFPVEEA